MDDYPTLGIDPGSRDGAAVLLDSDGRTVLHWCCWWSGRRKAGRVLWGAEAGRGRREADGLGPLLASMLPGWEAHVVCEELLAISGRRMTPRTLIPLAEATGRVLGVLEGLALSERRVLAQEWRRVVLGLPPRMDAARAEATAVEGAPRAYDWPEWYDVEALPKVARGAVCEAACIARWGVVTRGEM